MATHDYVIANGTGAAVRSDLNNALAAIVSNNSGSSEPGTTYAYQWWADTNANVLKIRNSSNDGWITLRELDGTLLMEDGSNSAPGLSFASDTNTGFFSGGADKIGFATGGAERLEIGSSEVVFNDPSNDVDFRVESNGNTHCLYVDAGNNRVGINTASPGFKLHCVESGSAAAICASSDVSADALASRLALGNSVGTARFTINMKGGGSELAYLGTEGNFPMYFQTNGAEKARLDASGRFLVGTSTGSGEPIAAFEGRSNDASDSGIVAITRTGTNPSGSIGELRFATGSDFNKYYGMILCASDGSTSSTSLPGVLRFSTTSSGATSPTERARIDSQGRLLVGLNSSGSGSLIEAKTASVTSSSSVLGVKAFTANIPYATSNKTSSMLSGYDGGTIHGVDVGYSYDGSGYYFSIATNDSTGGTPDERFRIDRNGQIGILANTNPITARSTAGATTVNEYFTGLHSATAVHTSGTVSIKIYTNGNIQNTNNSYGSLSDAKLKENIVDASSQWDDIKGIRIRNYNFIEGQTHTQLGVVAQEVETVSPGLVYETPDRETVQVPVLDKNGEAVLDENGEAVLTAQERELGTTTKSVSYSVLYMKAVKALQEAMDRIETLETKVAALEAG